MAAESRAGRQRRHCLAPGGRATLLTAQGPTRPSRREPGSGHERKLTLREREGRTSCPIKFPVTLCRQLRTIAARIEAMSIAPSMQAPDSVTPGCESHLISDAAHLENLERVGLRSSTSLPRRPLPFAGNGCGNGGGSTGPSTATAAGACVSSQLAADDSPGWLVPTSDRRSSQSIQARPANMEVS